MPDTVAEHFAGRLAGAKSIRGWINKMLKSFAVASLIVCCHVSVLAADGSDAVVPSALIPRITARFGETQSIDLTYDDSITQLDGSKKFERRRWVEDLNGGRERLEVVEYGD